MDLLRLGSPGDPIARAQAGRVRALLEARPDVLACVDMVVIESCVSPNEMRHLTGLLQESRADAVVCPVDRLPAELPRGIVARAFVRDRTPLYRCVSIDATTLAGLPDSATVVVCDRVARAQILSRYPGLNVVFEPASDEMLGHLRDGRWDAALLPADILETASLVGLRWQSVAMSDVIPAVGLGAVAVLVRDVPLVAHDLVHGLNDPMVTLRFRLERMFVAEFTAISDTVCTAMAGGTNDHVELTGLIAEKDGRWCVRESVSGPVAQAEAMTRRLAATCTEKAEIERGCDVAR